MAGIEWSMRASASMLAPRFLCQHKDCLKLAVQGASTNYFNKKNLSFTRN